ncbi:MAG: PIN domain-containing protein [Myxococcota bacterium]|nr:PIN domain-containing protein [Myxococcota bacterium]
MKLRVYLDTTIPSYAVDRRADLVVRYRRSITGRLLAARRRFEFCVSEVVRAELTRGRFPGQAEALRAIAGFPDLPLVPESLQVAEHFRLNLLVPSYDIGDSLHLALAAVHQVPVVATWNHRHLANPRKRRHLAVLCARLRLAAPDVVSPEDLLEEE